MNKILTKIFKRELITSDDSLLNVDSPSFNILNDLFSSSGGTPSSANAHTYEDVYTCVNILSDDIAKLPIKTYLKNKSGITRVKDTPVAILVGKQPHRYMTPFVFKKLMMVDVLTSGNFYSLIKFDKNGVVEELIPLSAHSTRAVKDTTGGMWYQSTVGGQIRYFYPHEIVHIKGYTTDGLTGKSPIGVIADSVEGNSAAAKFNKDLLERGGTPEGLISIPGQLSRDAKAKVKSEWQRTNGKDAIAVIDSGMEYKQIGVTPRDMQFVDSQKYNQQKIAAVFKIPLHKINNLDHATFSNIEHQSIDYVKNTLQPWIVQIEEEFNNKLFLDSEIKKGYYIKFNLASELRGDAKSQAEVEELNLRNATTTIDELREQNERSPFNTEWSDRPMVTLNYTFADNLLAYQNARHNVVTESDSQSKVKFVDEDDDSKGGDKESDGEGDTTT